MQRMDEGRVVWMGGGAVSGLKPLEWGLAGVFIGSIVI